MNAHVAFCLLLSYMSFGLIAGTTNSYIEVFVKAFESVTRSGNISMYNEQRELVPLTQNQNPNQKYPGRITFSFYTRNNDPAGWNIRINQPDDLARSRFNVSNPTYFITHGWLTTSRARGCILIRHAYLRNCNSCNVIVVDWSKYSLARNYLDAVDKVNTAAQTVARMIKYLYTQGLTWDKITLVGFSLGAHVMGIAGYNVEPKVKQLIGLDPALPAFQLAPPGAGLTYWDARNVQIIHTNAGGLGYQCPNGHADFYPNGGAQQNGCCDEFAKVAHATLEQQIPVIVKCAACSHERAYEYFAESIANTFNATKCAPNELFQWDSCGWAKPRHFAPMGGIKPNKIKQGVYYLRTAPKSPFSIPISRNHLITPPTLDPFPLALSGWCSATDSRGIGSTK